MSPNPELVKQVAEEYKEILNAPPIRYGPTIPTCHFCGSILEDNEAERVEEGKHHEHGGPIHGVERFRGNCCGGNPNRKS